MKCKSELCAITSYIFKFKLFPSAPYTQNSNRSLPFNLSHQKLKVIQIGNLNMSTSEGNLSKNTIERKAEVLEPSIKLEGEIVKGFGRGSKEIGCPTANFSQEVVESKFPKSLGSGIYLGWARLSDDSENVEKAVISIGWNPFYGNTKKSVETHIIKTYDADFYGAWMKLNICGFIRPELNFESLDSLITAINDDIDHAKLHLEKETFQKMKDDEFLNN